MVTGIHEEVANCSPSTSSEKQRKISSTSQQPFRSENTPATIEADQFFWDFSSWQTTIVLQVFYNNKIRISMLPKSLTTTIPTFYGKSENFELFAVLFQTSLKIHNQLTEDDRINHSHSLMKGDPLQTFKSSNGPTRKNLADILVVSRRNNVTPQPIATPKHKFQKLVFNQQNENWKTFFDELQNSYLPKSHHT